MDSLTQTAFDDALLWLRARISGLESLQVVHNADSGRGIVATRDIPAGHSIEIPIELAVLADDALRSDAWVQATSRAEEAGIAAKLLTPEVALAVFVLVEQAKGSGSRIAPRRPSSSRAEEPRPRGSSFSGWRRSPSP